MRNKNDYGIKLNGMAKLRNTILINDDFNKNIKTDHLVDGKIVQNQ